MPPRLHLPLPLASQSGLALPPNVARHVQVLRLQPGDALTLFNGDGGEWAATVARIGRSEVWVDVGAHELVDRELSLQVTLAMGMPTNDRMDALVEKATELGVAAIQPLLTERSVLRLSGERADKRRDHWQAVAVAAAEQSGRTRVPYIAPVRSLRDWLSGLPGDAAQARWLLSFGPSEPLSTLCANVDVARPIQVLSGPEGGLSPAEELGAVGAGFQCVGLGPRVLRADTAPLAVLAVLGQRGTAPSFPSLR
jgi:16S rRNA (uracil1498-N3)-methyltransferase